MYRRAKIYFLFDFGNRSLWSSSEFREGKTKRISMPRSSFKCGRFNFVSMHVSNLYEPRYIFGYDMDKFLVTYSQNGYPVLYINYQWYLYGWYFIPADHICSYKWILVRLCYEWKFDIAINHFSTSHTVHLCHIPLHTIQNRNVQVSFPIGAFWDMARVHYEFCEIGLLETKKEGSNESTGIIYIPGRFIKWDLQLPVVGACDPEMPSGFKNTKTGPQSSPMLC